METATMSPTRIRHPLFQRISPIFPMHAYKFSRVDEPYAGIVDLSHNAHYSISFWQHCILNKRAVRASFESYALLELRHYKNSLNPLHEFLIGEFKSGSDVIFVATERGTRGNAQFTTEAWKFITVETLALLDIDPYDMFWVVPDERTFDAAVTSIIEGRKSRSPSSAFVPCGSVKYRFDDKSTSTSSNTPSTTPRPTLMHLAIAAFSAHDTTNSWIDDERSLYAHAIRQIFIDKFPTSEPVVVEQTKDTAKAFPRLSEMYDLLEQDWLGTKTDKEISESDGSDTESPESESTNASKGMSKEVSKLEVERQQYLDQAQETEREIEAARREMERLESLPQNERAGYKSERRLKLEFAKLEAQHQLYLAQAERTEHEMEVAILDSERVECGQELKEYQGKIKEIEGALAKSVRR